MARTTINSQGVPVGTITASDLSYPLTDFSSTGIDDNASSNAITISSSQAVTMSGLTYPTTDGTANQVLTTDGSGGLSFADTSSGGVEYVAKTTTYTASANEGIIANTSGGAWTLTLPASPSAGDKVFVADGDDWSTNNLTVARNGSTIEGSAADFTMDYGGVNVGFIYDGSTWQVYPQAGLLQLMGIDDNATSTALTINSSGNVGIGIDPVHELDILANGGATLRVANETDSTAKLILRNVGSSDGSISQAAGNMSFAIGASEAMRINSSGNVGINQSNPAQKLDVSGNVKLTGQLFQSMPSDFWSQGTTFIEINGMGNLTHQGSFETCLTSNGYRDNNNQWKSYAINGYTGASQIKLNPQGHISFRADSNKADGSSQTPTEIARMDTSGLSIKSGGTFYEQNSSTTTTYQNNGQTGTYNKTVLYTNANNTSASILNGWYLELGRLTDSSSAETRKFHIAMRGGQSIASFDADGLKFGTDTAAANALDDYEEGTWTPTVWAANGTTVLTSGTDYAVQTAAYTKVGNLVHVIYRIRDLRSTRDSLISTIPLASAHSDYTVGIAIAANSAYGPGEIFMRSGGSTVQFRYNMATQQYKYGTFTYLTAS